MKTNHSSKKLQIQLYENLKAKAQQIESGQSPLLKEYKKEQETIFKRKINQVSNSYFASKLKKSKIVYVGDFHTFDQNSKNFIRLLKNLETTSKKPPVLMVEIFQNEYQELLDSFLKGYISEGELLKDANYFSSWRFPWTHYKEIFYYAKKKSIKILAVNSKGTLEQRDQFVSNQISQAIDNNSNTNIVLLFGELHIMPSKIPGIVKEKYEKIEDMIIYQNVDKVFETYPLRKNKRIYSFNQREFIIQTSPAWIKYESLVYWYENISEDPDFDIKEAHLANFSKNLNSNSNGNFQSFAKKFVKFFETLKVNEGDVDDFHLYDSNKFSKILKDLKSHTPFQAVFDFVLFLLTKESFFKIPVLRNSYFSLHYSVNGIVSLSATHVFSKYLQSYGIFHHNIFMNLDRSLFLKTYIHEFCFTYIASKVFNPYRKCDLYVDFKNRLENENTDIQSREIMSSVLKIIDGKNISEKSYSYESLFLMSKFIGKFLGELIFQENAQKSYLAFIQDSLTSSKKLPDLTSTFERFLYTIDFQKSKKVFF